MEDYTGIETNVATDNNLDGSSKYKIVGQKQEKRICDFIYIKEKKNKQNCIIIFRNLHMGVKL